MRNIPRIAFRDQFRVVAHIYNAARPSNWLAFFALGLTRGSMLAGASVEPKSNR
jgi:hypothetical protein